MIARRHHPFLSPVFAQKVFDIYRGLFLFYANKHIFEHDLLLAILISIYSTLIVLTDSSKNNVLAMPFVPTLLIFRKATHFNVFFSFFFVQFSLHFTTMSSTNFTKNSITFANFLLDLSIIEISFGNFLGQTLCSKHD